MNTFDNQQLGQANTNKSSAIPVLVGLLLASLAGAGYMYTVNGWLGVDNKKQTNRYSESAIRPIEVSTPAVMPSVESDGRPVLKMSHELNFVVPFADGREVLGPQGREVVKSVAERADSASRIQILGYAGYNSVEGRRESMAFGRAYSVRDELINDGVNEELIKIQDPNISIPALREIDNTPRVVINLLPKE